MNKKTNKLLKILGASGLAFFMGIGTLCAVLLAPAGSASRLSNQHENAVVSNEDLAAEIKNYKEDIAAGKITYAPSALGLDPENDPVLWTTATGLEVKQSNAISNPNLSKYLYVTMGEYNGYAINWLICAYPRYVGENSDPAGQAVYSEIDNNFYHTNVIQGTSGVYFDVTLEKNHFKLISECVLGSCQGMKIARGEYNVGEIELLNGQYSSYNINLRGTNLYQQNLNTYISNDTFKLNAFIDSGIIVENIFGLTTVDADNLTSRIAYNIGTTTPAAWWHVDEWSRDPESAWQSGTRTIYRTVYDESGNKNVIKIGTCYGSYSSNGFYGSTSVSPVSPIPEAGVRVGIIAKLM